MGAAQYLRDFRRAHNLKKSAELRKRVLQRQEKRKEQSDSVPYKVYMYPKNFMNVMVNFTNLSGCEFSEEERSSIKSLRH